MKNFKFKRPQSCKKNLDRQENTQRVIETGLNSRERSSKIIRNTLAL